MKTTCPPRMLCVSVALGLAAVASAQDAPKSPEPSEEALERLEELDDDINAYIQEWREEQEELAKKAIAENKLNWRGFQNTPEGAESSISTAWAIKGWPTVVVLDENFQIRYRGHDGNKATEVAKRLVAELEKK